MKFFSLFWWVLLLASSSESGGERKSWDGEKASDRYFSKAAEMVGIGQGRGGEGRVEEAGQEERREEEK